MLQKRPTPSNSSGDLPKSYQKYQNSQRIEQPDLEDSNSNWGYLEHHGVLFPQIFQPSGLHIIYEGSKVPLTPKQEEIAVYWCQALGTDYENQKIYRTNAASLFSNLTKGRMHFDKIDFSPVSKHLERQKALKKEEQLKKKEMSKKDKELEKIEKDSYYMYALIDGRLEKIGGYMVEPPTLFRGRGNNPRNGFLKSRITPEDITLNTTKDAPVPMCNEPGHAWGSIVHKDDVTWLAYYKDNSIKKQLKYFGFGSNSVFKSKSDFKKYEKARSLKGKIAQIREDYQKKITSTSLIDNQLGVITYIIDKLAIRAGNEKNEEMEADTVGCCSLRCEHITPKENDVLHLKFLGKDSIEYNNEVKVDKNVYQRVLRCLKNKSPQDKLFELVSTSKLNEYLQTQMKGLTAKVFRTYNASSTLDQCLQEVGAPRNLDALNKVRLYNEANKKVAVLCNHQKAVSKGFEQKVTLHEAKIDDLKEYYKKLKKHSKNLSKGQSGYKSEPKARPGKVRRVYAASEKAAQNAVIKIKDKIKGEELKLEEKKDGKNISLGTSKINYNDPRITVAWSKRVDLQIEKVFSRELRMKFAWAMSTPPNWKF